MSNRAVILALALLTIITPSQIGAAPAAGASAQSAQKELAGKVALITGSSRNLGRGYAVALARNGADIVAHYHLPADRGDAEETARLVRAQGARAILVSGDLCDVSTITRMFDQTLQSFGRVDIVVNSAGRIVKKPVAEMTEQDFDSVFCVNARGAFFVMREAARRISDNGRIINIGSSLISSTIGEYSVYA
ncbi:MAG TPA: SDR family NAD(P)-dependent oxidoreductase, partial [Blastocatellia bacterium]